jgi:hypothetical protein
MPVFKFDTKICCFVSPKGTPVTCPHRKPLNWSAGQQAGPHGVGMSGAQKVADECTYAQPCGFQRDTTITVSVPVVEE